MEWNPAGECGKWACVFKWREKKENKRKKRDDGQKREKRHLWDEWWRLNGLGGHVWSQNIWLLRFISFFFSFFFFPFFFKKLGGYSWWLPGPMRAAKAASPVARWLGSEFSQDIYENVWCVNHIYENVWCVVTTKVGQSYICSLLLNLMMVFTSPGSYREGWLAFWKLMC